MAKQTSILLAAAAVFLAAFLIVEKQASPFFQTCISQGIGNESTKTSDESLRRIGSVIITYAQCTGRFIDVHGAGITALFTIVLAASTILLWIVTNKAATAAQAAAEHIPTVEGAFVYVVMNSDLIGGRLNSIEKGQFEEGPPEIRINLKNFGKTPAFIEIFRARLSYVSVGAARKDRDETSIQSNTIIGAGDESPTKPGLQIAFQNMTQAEAVHAKKHSGTDHLDRKPSLQ
jgi:hypothetical protein